MAVLTIEGSEGAEVEFGLPGRDETLTVFTTRPDTLFGATYMVLAPEHPLVGELTTEDLRAEVEAYVAEATYALAQRVYAKAPEAADDPKDGAIDGRSDDLSLLTGDIDLELREGDVAGNPREEVVEVVGDAAGESADGFHLLSVIQLVL